MSAYWPVQLSFALHQDRRSFNTVAGCYENAAKSEKEVPVVTQIQTHLVYLDAVDEKQQNHNDTSAGQVDKVSRPGRLRHRPPALRKNLPQNQHEEDKPWNSHGKQ
jgi:hypothetical protein